MARVISQINPETGRRQKIGTVEGNTFQERTKNIAGAFDVTNRKALGMSNADLVKKIGTIPVSTLTTPVSPAVVPTMPTSTIATDLISDLGTQADAYQKNLDRQAQLAKDAETTSFERLLTETLNAPTAEGLQTEAYKKSGVDTLQSELTDINQQLLTESEVLRKKSEEIQTRAGTATKAERDYQVQELTRTSLRKQADLAIIQLSRQGRFNDAKAIADRAVEAQLADSKRKLDVLSLAYDRNKSLFSKDEQRAFETSQADRTRALDAEEFKMKADYEQRIRQSDPLYKLDVALKNAQLQGENLKLEALKNPSSVSGISPETADRMDKLPLTEKQALVDAGDTIDQLTRLQDLITTTDIVTLQNPLSAQGILFRRLATDVADKMARKRTGAVVTDSEQASFKKILGLSFGTRLASDPETVKTELNKFKNLHESTATLIDPRGDIREALRENLPGSIEDTYLNEVDKALGGNDSISTYLNSFNLQTQ